MFVDLDTFQSTFSSSFSLLYLKDLAIQNADGNVKAIKSALSILNLYHFLQKMGFIANDGASVNIGLKGGVAAKFKDEGELS